MLYSVKIGKNIVTLIKAKNITQKELAAKACISVSRLRDVEHSRVNSSLGALERIADALNLHPLSLLLLNTNPKQEITDQAIPAPAEPPLTS